MAKPLPGTGCGREIRSSVVLWWGQNTLDEKWWWDSQMGVGEVERTCWNWLACKEPWGEGEGTADLDLLTQLQLPL